MKLLVTMILLATGLTTFAQDVMRNPETVLISPTKTLSKNDTVFRKSIAQWSDEILKSTDYKSVKSQPSSDIFPGAVKSGYQFVNKAVKITHTKLADNLVPIVSTLGYSGYDNATMYSTGLYAVAGEYVEIDVPKHANVKELEVQIGAHSDRLNTWVAGKEDWRRMPIITKKQKLETGKNRLASPFGGLIYINVKPKADSREIDVKISHAVEAPLFVLGKSSVSDWQNQLKNNKAPWGEMATENVILTLPDSVLQTIKNPEEVLKLWDLVVLGELDLANIPAPFYRPQRMVPDEHIGGGYMHSGYPIMIHHSPTRKMLSNEIMANPELLMKPSKGGANWGFFHEIGHNMQNLNWVFGGTTEVSNNFFSLYMFDRLIGGRDDAHSGVSSVNTQKMMKKYFAEGPSYEKWKSDPFLGLIMFRQMQEGFGWESFKSFFKEYQTIGSEIRRLNDQKKRDLWVKTYSDVVKRDLAPFWEIWGIPISDDVKKELTKYPAWKPFNFPPQN
ncbi:M60 family metallopeptidase [Pedobacter insulae]|uniref:Peptidase M60, enhancin and enhancin-like n=1 Tax=Pedobacter insulae TaxID=414048 RepID=A0A1I3A808_9SPHI|nr:M60 family metallopeptidase [Pedobacter insulae]SFH46050.1 Peptidase M60, enhancin and enhancin-like [Pedobacter insulae]